MARPYNPYQDDKEKRDLASARTDDLKSRTAQREDNRYPRSHGFSDLKTMTEAETARERGQTNQRLTENAALNSRIEATKAMAAMDPGGPHGKAALDALAKIAGITVPKIVDPKQAKLDELRKAKGLPPQGGEQKPDEQPQSNTTSEPQQNQSYFQPEAQPGTTDGLVAPAPGTQPVPAGNQEVGFGSPVTPHLGIGGAQITPENPTGNPANPWGAGGLFDNPTHAAAQNVQAREATAHPYGSGDIPAFNHLPGDAMDRLMGGSAPQPPNRLPPSPGLVAPPLTNYAPTPPVFDQSKLVQPGPAGPRTPPNINVDLDALASHIGNWFSSQAQQVKQRTNY